MVFLSSLRHFSLSDVFTPVLSIFLHLSTVWLLSPLLLPVSCCFLFDIIAALVQAPSYHHFSYLSSSMYMRILLDIFSLLFLLSSISSELHRGNFCGCWTFISYCLRCPFRYLSLQPFSVGPAYYQLCNYVISSVSIVPSVIWVCVLLSEVQRTTICASWLFAFYLSFRWFEPTSSGTEAQHTINCASQTAVRVWGKIQVFINKMMNASPTKKKRVCQAGSLEISCT